MQAGPQRGFPGETLKALYEGVQESCSYWKIWLLGYSVKKRDVGI